MALIRFSLNIYLCNFVIFFYNFIATNFARLDVSLCFNVFDSNVGLNTSVSKNNTSGYTCQKYSENNSRHTLICNKKPRICNEQKWHVGKLRSWFIINRFLMWNEPLLNFIVAIAMEVWKLHYLFYLIFQISMYSGLFSSQQLQIPGQMFLTTLLMFQRFKLNFWLVENEQRKIEIFSFGASSMDLSLWLCN